MPIPPAQRKNLEGDWIRKFPAETAMSMMDFRANDVVVYEANELFRDPNKPAFSRVVFKGGGDAVSAARAVLETGEFDYAWNLQVEPEILGRP